MNLKRHVGVLVAAVLLGSGLVGCAVEDERPAPYEPQVTHTPKPKNTDAADDGLDEDGADGAGSETEVLEPPPIPEEIYEETLEGAEAAARYYLEALDYGYAALDVDPLKFVCAESETCEEHQNRVNRSREDGEYFTGGEITEITIEETNPVKRGAVVYVSASQDASNRYDDNGSLIDSEEEAAGTIACLIEYIDGRWQITAIGAG